jgi:hypothetical protein
MQNPLNITLPSSFSGDTWDGFTWTVSDVPPEDTEFSGTLVKAIFQLQNSEKVPVLNLSSATAGQVTINTATPNAWSVTVEPRILTIPAGVYSYGLQTTDSDGVKKTRIAGVFEAPGAPVI